jgi:hypothetical protein
MATCGDRADRVSIVDKGASVEIRVDTDGDLSFDLHVATLTERGRTRDTRQRLAVKLR